MKIRVWDMPTRVFHWALVAVFIVAFISSRNESCLDVHSIAGYLALGLVIFRVLWGFAGNRYARFTDFVRGWTEVSAFISAALRHRRPPRVLGHNPVVGWVVLGMLCVTLILAITGVITYSGEEDLGAFAGLVSFEAATYGHSIHELAAGLIVLMIVVHVFAALIHDFVFRENIILSMITGVKEDEESLCERTSQMAPGEGRSLLTLIVWSVVAVLGGVAIVYLPPVGKTDFSRLQPPGVIDDKGHVSRVLPNGVWEAECATSCHNGFNPTLLPADSWRRVMAGLDDHFGDNVELDPEINKEILDYMVSASAERSVTEASKKLLHSIGPGAPPLRITEIPYWKEKHSEIDPKVFEGKSIASRSNCVACHPGSDKGSFEDRDIRIPE